LQWGVSVSRALHGGVAYGLKTTSSKKKRNTANNIQQNSVKPIDKSCQKISKPHECPPSFENRIACRVQRDVTKEKETGNQELAFQAVRGGRGNESQSVGKKMNLKNTKRTQYSTTGSTHT